MSAPIESYGFIGNRVSGALVGRDGPIDWLCLPHFDSDLFCRAARHGRARALANRAAGRHQRTKRRYLPGTAILETTFETATGAVAMTDFMPLTDDEDRVEVVRLVVRGLRGQVRMRMELIVRFGHGTIVPWVRRQDFGIRAIAGPDALDLRTPVDLHGEDFTRVGEFSVEGATVPFVLAYYRSHRQGAPERAAAANAASDARPVAAEPLSKT